MKDKSDCCDCCAGIQAATPVPIANRPGLPAIAYRAGTHSAFLDSMLAQLTQQTVDDTGDRPLRTLSVRSPDDPSIAFLDAFATLADVLTFYQERIANEGFLRTATERQSVVELARLVGYRPRPGVAAGTYLAYTLEASAQVTILAGSRVQSVPGPGELPQTFETSDDLAARGEWNVLTPRQTRPPDPASFTTVTSDDVPVYLKGITTGLNPGDPLLVDLGDQQELFRVVSVAPDSLADRTQVGLRPWRATSTRPAPLLPEPEMALPGMFEDPAALLDLITRSSDLEAAGVQPQGVIAGRVIEVLGALRSSLGLGLSGEALHEYLRDVVLTALDTELGRAMRGRRGPLARWLSQVVLEFRQIVERESAVRDAQAVAVPPARPVPQPARSTTIGAVLPDLARPVSVPPSGPLRLKRGLRDSLGAHSDTIPGLLVAMRPDLGQTLYDAWRAVPSTPPAFLQVYALRIRAAAFGSTAPPQPVLDSRGAVIGSREWTLYRAAGDQVPETFQVVMQLPLSPHGGLALSPQPEDTVHTTVAVGNVAQTATPTLQELYDGDFPIDLPQAGEQVLFTLQDIALSPPTPASLVVEFVQRGMRFETTLEVAPTRPRATWSSQGSDPTEVCVEQVVTGPAGHTASFLQVSIDGTVLAPTGRVPTEQADVISLDAVYPAVAPDGWIVVDRPGSSGSPPDDDLIISQVKGARETARADYGLTAKVTSVQLDQPWLTFGPGGDTFGVIRGTAVYAQSEALELADVPLDPVADPVCGGEIPLDRLYEGLQPGRWLIVSGERTDVAGTPPGNSTAGGVPVSGVPAVELAMLGGIRQEYDPSEPGSFTLSTLVLANPLAYCYRRDTMTIYGNVIEATHGETRNEVLGSGDASQANQAFALKQKPLTYVAASTPTGSQSTLAGYVDGIRWQEADSPVALSPTDRTYVTKTDDQDVTTVVFGDGVEGARLPTGQENVTAVYRFGVGAVGNLQAGQLSLLGTRPQGVSAVTNPLPSTGGADREDRDQARRNAPLGVTSLDRVVSVQDYADFARTFAGIGKASASQLADGRHSLVHLTIAGEDDIPIDPVSPLYRNLRAALAEFGDPYQPFQIDPRRLLLLVIEARVRLDADRLWEERAPVIRQAVFDRFSFARRDLGQDVARGEVIAAIQDVPGVSYVDLDLLDTVDEQQVIDELTAANPGAIGAGLRLRHRIRAHLARVNPAPPPQIIPAELVILRSSVPDTLAITEISA
jgi:hypothetical protein